MAFHVACPITCKRICYCTLGFPGNPRSDNSNHDFSLQIAQLQQFLSDPCFARVSEVQVPVPKVSPTPPTLLLSADSSCDSGHGGADELVSTLTKRGSLQRMAAEDFARRFEFGLLQDAPRDAAGVDQGLSTVNLMCRLCFSGENEGSQREKKMLSCRSCSKKYHRRCLKTWAQHRDLFHWSSWTCPSCRICEVCHQTGDPNKFKFCKRCDAAYHCHCMQTPHKNVSSGPYLCPDHTKCHSCESNVPGNGLSVRWFLGYTCCDACGRLFTKGNYCPVCLKVYRDSESTPMVCCDICQRWVHCRCDNISDEKYLQFQADDNLPYTCRTCRGECYQVKDLEDAVLELWRRRDEDDRDLIAALRAAVGLPTQEEIFSISSFSDDEDYGPPGVKNEYGRVNVSLEGLAESFSKKTQDSGKKTSNKKKKKRYQMALDGKIGSNLISEGHQDAVSMSYGLSHVQDVILPLKRGHNALSSAEGICSISQQGDLKQKFVDEVGNNEKRHGILQIESKITNKVDAREDANKSLSKKTTKATKLVIHLGGRNRNTTNSPKSDTSSYQKEQELPVLNGANAGREAGGQHREGEALSSERSDSAANHDEGGRFDNFHGMRGVTLRGREGTVIRLGKRKTEISLKGTPVLLTKRSKGTTKAAGDRTSSRSGVAGESHKTQSQEPSTSCATPKDSQSLLKLKFKTPFLGSWISHGEEEKGVVKGQRSKRKRPSQKPKSEEDEDAPESHQDSLMNEILDASWILKKLGIDAIGKRVDVQQQSDNSWHKGIVSNLVKGTSMLSVDLDDGRTKTVELGKQGIRFVPQKQKRQKL